VDGTKSGHHFLDLAKREDILPGLRQVHWDLVIIDELTVVLVTRIRKNARYALGELIKGFFRPLSFALLHSSQRRS